MTTQNVPRKNYQLQNGTYGTEWEAYREKLVQLRKQLQNVEDEIELTVLRMSTAEGRPVDSSL